ncbi:MAG: Zn-dependent exopeptidase M28, partial [Actinobacteria bacterium]|nr:Zn-dependent exopeptidase M28 [Actinomycetota bacterium]
MESARPRIVRRRPRRGSIERPINLRLVRSASLALVVPVLLVGFTIARPGPLPPSATPSAFDAASATLLAQTLARDKPARVPGSATALAAGLWYREQLALYALPTSTDRWRETIRGLGTVQLQNVVTVIEGQSAAAIAVVAHRDSGAGTNGANDNASGTAALIELARAYAPTSSGSAGVRPLHTLVFLSTDAAAFGGAGIRRFLASPIARDVIAAVVLDGIGGSARPAIRVGGIGGRSPAPSLVRTVASRIDGAVPMGARSPGLLEQVVGLGLGFGYGEQAVLLGSGISAVRIGNSSDGEGAPGADPTSAI